MFWGFWGFWRLLGLRNLWKLFCPITDVVVCKPCNEKIGDARGGRTSVTVEDDVHRPQNDKVNKFIFLIKKFYTLSCSTHCKNQLSYTNLGVFFFFEIEAFFIEVTPSGLAGKSTLCQKGDKSFQSTCKLAPLLSCASYLWLLWHRACKCDWHASLSKFPLHMAQRKTSTSKISLQSGTWTKSHWVQVFLLAHWDGAFM